MTRQQKKQRLIKAYKELVIAFYAYIEWYEKKHGIETEDKGNNEDQPRDKKTGKFVKAGTSSFIEITGNEFDNYKHLSTISERAKQYYKENLSGTSFEDEDIGRVYFGKYLVDESINKINCKNDVLYTVPYLIDLTNTGEKQAIQDLEHERTDEFKKFIPVKNKIKIKNKTYKVKIKIGIKNYNEINEHKEAYVVMIGSAKREKRKKKTSDTVVVATPQPQKRGKHPCTKSTGDRSSSVSPINNNVYYEIIDVNII